MKLTGLKEVSLESMGQVRGLGVIDRLATLAFMHTLAFSFSNHGDLIKHLMYTVCLRCPWWSPSSIHCLSLELTLCSKGIIFTFFCSPGPCSCNFLSHQLAIYDWVSTERRVECWGYVLNFQSFYHLWSSIFQDHLCKCLGKTEFLLSSYLILPMGCTQCKRIFVRLMLLPRIM